MSLNTRNAKEYQRIRKLQVSQNQPKWCLRGFSVLSHPKQPSLTCRSEKSKRHHYPTIPCSPWSSKSRVFLTAYYNCKHFSLYTCEVLGCLFGISPSRRNSCGGNYITKMECALWLAEKRAVNTGVTSRVLAVRALISQAQIWKMFWGENSTNLTNLLYLSISSRVCITVSNYPSPFHVYIKLCKHGKRAFSIA